MCVILIHKFCVGLAPDDALEAARADMLMDCIKDILEEGIDIMYNEKDAKAKV